MEFTQHIIEEQNILKANNVTILDCVKEYRNNNGYRYMVTKHGTPFMLCRDEKDVFEVVNDIETYGLGLIVTDLEKIKEI